MNLLSDADCVLMLQALGEFFHPVTRKAKMPADEAAALVHDWMELFPVAAADGRTLRDAIGLKNAHGIARPVASLVRPWFLAHQPARTALVSLPSSG